MNADREYRLELSLRNCLALACQKRSRDPEAWGHVIRFCREAGVEPSILRDAGPGVDALEARAAETYGGFEYNGPGEECLRRGPPTVAARSAGQGDAPRCGAPTDGRDLRRRSLLGHMGAIRKFIDAARTLEDGAAESNSTWPSQALESDADAAERALRFIGDLLGVPLEAK